MKILGISAYYHNSAASLIIDGNIIAHAAEERFSRIKNDGGFPKKAIDFCLKQANIEAQDLDEIVYYTNPGLVASRIFENIKYANKNNKLLENILFRTEKRLWIKNEFCEIYKCLGKNNRIKIVDHHISHAASAFFPSPFNEAIIVTIDGVGEKNTLTIGTGKGNKLQLYKSIDYPHSLGLFYSALSWFCGFKVNSGEYKFMGLAPYGMPIYKDLILNNLIKCNDDGSFKLNLEYYDFYNGNEIINRAKFEQLFKIKRRNVGGEINQVYVDIASSAQAVLEEILLKIVKYAKDEYGKNINSLVLAGGVALNCVANGKIANSGIFDHVWIQPLADDSGGALGAALFTYYELTNAQRIPNDNYMQGTFLGPCYSENEILDAVVGSQCKITRYDSDDRLEQKIGELIANEKIVAIFCGRMEAGPRALGNRSILADSTSEKMQSIMNLKIKKRESFRPFAPMVMDEYFDNYFYRSEAAEYSYMTFTTKIKDNKRIPFTINRNDSDEQELDIIKLVNEPRSCVPAITHVDYSARVQTVKKESNKFIWGIINSFNSIKNCPVIINTSFNVRGEPIVCSPTDAYNCFENTNIDVLVMENYLIEKMEKNNEN